MKLLKKIGVVSYLFIFLISTMGMSGGEEVSILTPPNHPPEITSFSPDTTLPEINEGTSLDFSFTAMDDEDGTNLTNKWTLDGVDVSADVAYTYTSDFSSAGGHTVTLFVYDTQGAQDTQSWDVTVYDVNRPPVWNVEPTDLTIEEDGILETTFYASDPDGDDIEYSVYDEDEEFEIDPDTGELYWEAPEDDYGEWEIEVSATDSQETIYAELTVTVTPVNDAPEISELPGVMFEEDTSSISIPLDDYVTDIDNDDSELTWSFSGDGNVNPTIDEGRNLFFTAAQDYFGVGIVTLTVSDGEFEVSRDLEVDVTPVNDAPEISELPEVSFEEDSVSGSFLLDDYVTDIDNDDSGLIWSFSGNENIHPAIDWGRNLVFTAEENYFGSELITLTVSDGEFEVSAAFDVWVTAVNDGPEISELPGVMFEEDTSSISIPLDDYVTDIDNDDSELTWTFSGDGNVNPTIDEGRNLVFTAEENYFGTETITLTVGDGEFEVENGIRVVVNSVNDGPEISEIPEVTFEEDGESLGISLDGYVQDVDHADSELTWSFSGNNQVTPLITEGRTLTFTAEENYFGIESIALVVTDGEYEVDTGLNVIVTSVNDLPEMEIFGDVSYTEGDLVNLLPETSDVDDDELTLNFSSPLDAIGQWQTNYTSEGIHTITITVDDGSGGIVNQEFFLTIKNDADEDGSEDEGDLDDDNDGVEDDEDTLEGYANWTDNNFNASEFVFTIDGEEGQSSSLEGIKEVVFKEGDRKILTFNRNFSESTLYLPNITIQKQDSGNGFGSLLIRGLNLSEDDTKTVYLDNLDSSLSSICVKDSEVESLLDISSNCTASYETMVLCDGTTYGNFTCEQEDSTYKITGLKHSAVKEQELCPEVWDCSGLGDCTAGVQEQTCIEVSNCGTTFSRPALSQSCTVDSGGSTAGGGGRRVVVNNTTQEELSEEPIASEPTGEVGVTGEEETSPEDVISTEDQNIQTEGGFFGNIGDITGAAIGVGEGKIPTAVVIGGVLLVMVSIFYFVRRAGKRRRLNKKRSFPPGKHNEE